MGGPRIYVVSEQEVPGRTGLLQNSNVTFLPLRRNCLYSNKILIKSTLQSLKLEWCICGFENDESNFFAYKRPAIATETSCRRKQKSTSRKQ